MNRIVFAKENLPWFWNCGAGSFSLALTVFCLSTMGCSSQPIAEENHALREQGMALCVAGNTKDAAIFFKKLLAANDKSADAHYGLGAVYAAEDEYDKAIAEFSRAIELNPRFEEAYNDRGNQYLNKELYDQAIADYTTAIEFGPQHYIHWGGRSRAYLEKGEFAKARMDATEAISRAPKYAPLYVRRARAEKALNLLSEAQADFNIALSLPASSTREFKALGSYLQDDGAPSRALEQYDKVIALDPKDYGAYKGRSECYQAMGKLVEARADLNMAARYAPEPDWYKAFFLTLDDLDYDAAHGVPLPERWALACTALMFTKNDDGCNSLLGEAPTEANIQGQSEAISEWWGIESRENLLSQLEALRTDGGYNQTWKEYVMYQEAGISFEHVRDVIDDITEGNFSSRSAIVKEYGPKFGERGILAWDLCRYICLVRWGLMLDFISEKEAIDLIMPVARRLQSTYGSWKQMGEEYLIGRRFWNEKRWKEGEAEYDTIYKTLLTEKNSPWVTIPWNTDLDPSTSPEPLQSKHQ